MILLKEILELTPEGNLKITDLDDISPGEWGQINHIMVQKGYNMRGGDDCKRAVEKFLANPNNSTPGAINRDIYEAWVDTIAMVMHLKHGKSTGGTSYDPKKVIRSAVREFGLTNNIREAGYILPNGGLLSLSGNPNHRDLDHREINGVYIRLGISVPGDRHSNSNFLNAFMKDCRVVRIGGSQPMMDLWHEPTRQQAVRLLKFFDQFNGEIFVVTKSEKWGSAEGQYPKGTSPTKILGEIVHFYKTGKLPSAKFDSAF